MLKLFVKEIEARTFPAEELQQMQARMAEIEQTEAYQDYGTPFAVDTWNKFFAGH